MESKSKAKQRERFFVGVLKVREMEKKVREMENEGEWKKEENWGVVRRKVVGGGGSVPADGEDVPEARGDVPADADRADAGYDCDFSTSCINRLSIYVCLSNLN